MGLKIEAGKFYRTRSGQKAFVVGRVPSGTLGSCNYQENIGFIADVHGIPDWWRDDGRYRTSGSPCEHDLVSEWAEPKRIKGYVRLSSPEGADFIYATFHTERPRGLGAKENLLACIEVDVEEGLGL